MQNNPLGPAHVLVVDDDPTVAEVVAGYLHRAATTSDARPTARPRSRTSHAAARTWSSWT